MIETYLEVELQINFLLDLIINSSIGERIPFVP